MVSKKNKIVIKTARPVFIVYYGVTQQCNINYKSAIMKKIMQ